MVLRWLRLPLVLGIALGLAAPAEAQLWKPTKKKPAAASKAKSNPSAPRKVGRPTKRKARSKARSKPRAGRDDSPKVTTAGAGEFDDAPIITISDGDGVE